MNTGNKGIQLLIYILIIPIHICNSQAVFRPSVFVESAFMASVGKNPPYYSVSNHHGRFSSEKNAFLIETGLSNNLDTSRSISMGYGLDAIYRYDSHHAFWVQQAYVSLKAYFLIFQGGMIEETYGNQDELLSSGAYLFSENARPIPRIKISTNDYVVIPITSNLLEIKAGMSHGWFGEEDQYVTGAYLHHKYAYMRIGERKFRFSFNLGFQHAAMWGGVSPDSGKLSADLKAFGSVFKGKMGNDRGPVNEQINAVGNHLGSYSLGIDYKMDHHKISVYWQTMLEDKNGRVGVDWKNKGDGLWGISIIKTDQSNGLQRINFEFFNSTSQSGDPNRSGNDNYFNNYLYKSGWTNHKMTIGNPLITSPIFTNRNPEMVNYLDNNSVRAFIAGILYNVHEHQLCLKAAYSRNCGTIMLPYSKIRHQFSSVAEYTYHSKRYRNLLYSWQAAFDIGSHLGNNAGLMFKIRKTF